MAGDEIDLGLAGTVPGGAPSDPPRPWHPRVGDVVNGSFHVYDVLGGGGFGKVFQATDQKLSRESLSEAATWPCRS